MIDKLELRIPCDAPFHPEFNRLYSELRANPKIDPFRRSRHYELVGDLRPYGYDVILNMHYRWGKVGNHKLELVGTGQMSYARMINEIEEIFQIDAMRLGVMRVDLAADVNGIPVGWFQERVKARHKQFIAEFGSAEFVEMGRGGIQTLYFGRRPNLFRIYDKVAEYKDQFQKMTRQLDSALPKPTFEQTYRIPEDGYVLTRVERQIGGGRVPEQLATVADLRRAPDFRPFDALGIITGGEAEPNPDHYTFEHYCTGMYLRDLAQRHGMHVAIRFITRYSNRNTKWALEKYRDFLPQEHEDEMVNTDYLNEVYRHSVTRQLAA